MAERIFTALDWVTGEIDETLTQARNQLEAYVVDTHDASRLAFCLSQIHQIFRILQMVEFHGGAMLAEEMEILVQAMISGDVTNTPDACEVLMRAILQLPIYIGRVKESRGDDPASLMSLFNDLRAVRGGQLLTATALFSPDMSAAKKVSGTPLMIDEAKFAEAMKKTRQVYQQTLLNLIKDKNFDDRLQALNKIFGNLKKVSVGTPREALWDICLALMEGIGNDSIPASIAINSLLKRVDNELRDINAAGRAGLHKFTPDDLIKNMLYYVALSNSDSPLITAAKDKYKLNQAIAQSDSAGNAPQTFLAGPSPDAMRSVVVAMSEEFHKVKTIFDEYAAGQHVDNAALKQLLPLFKQGADTLAVLGEQEQRRKLESLHKELDAIVQGPCATDDALMDTAAHLLEVETALNAKYNRDARGDEPGVDGAPQSMDAAILTAQDSVLLECHNGLEQAKDAIIEFIASQWDATHLKPLPALFQGVRGGLEMVNQRRSARVIGACTRFIQEKLLSSAGGPEWQLMDRLADALTSVEYYLECLDEDVIEEEDHVLDVAEESVAALGYPVAVRKREVEVSTSDHDTHAILEEIVAHADEKLVGTQEVETVETEASDESALAASSADDESIPSLEDDIASSDDNRPAITHNAAWDDAPSDQDIDFELWDIFVAEATGLLDVVDEWAEWARAQAPLAVEPSESMQRALHTLKGSAYMAGLTSIGDFAKPLEKFSKELRGFQMKIGDEFIAITQEFVGCIRVGVAQIAAHKLLALPPGADELLERIKVMRFATTSGRDDEEVVSAGHDSHAASLAMANPARLEAFLTHEFNSMMHADALLQHWIEQPFDAVIVEPLIDELTKLEDAAKQALLEPLAQLCHLMLQAYARVQDHHGIGRTQLRPVIVKAHEGIMSLIDMRAAGLDLVADPVIMRELAQFLTEDLSESAPVQFAEDEGIDQQEVEEHFIEEQEAEEPEEAALELPAEEELAAIPEPAPAAAAKPAPWTIKVPETAPYDTDDYDAEIAEIFIEEAREVLEAINEYFPQWREDYNNIDALKEFRRGFHTLKGSGRMAQALFVGELSWSVENMLNRVLEKNIQATPAMCELIQRVIDKLPSMIDAFEARQPDPDHALTVALHTAGAAFSLGETPVLDVVSAPEAAPVEEVIVEIVEPVAEEAPIEYAHAETLTESFDDIDLELLEIFIEEANELVEEIDATIHAWSNNPDDKKYAVALNRSLHTLKGGARMAGLQVFGTLAHDLESWLEHYEGAADSALFRKLNDYNDRLLKMAGLAQQLANGDTNVSFAALMPGVTAASVVAAEEPELELAAQPEVAEELMPELTAEEEFVPELMTEEPVLEHTEEEFVPELVAEESEFEIVEEEFLPELVAGESAFELAEEEFVPELVAEEPELELAEEAFVPELVAEEPELIEEEPVPELVEEAFVPELIPEEPELEFAEAETLAQLKAAEEEFFAPTPEPVVVQTVVHAGLEVSPDIENEMLEIFLEEADELLEELDAEIQGWSDDLGNLGFCDSLKRILHTLKGGARMCGLMGLGQLGHDLETFLETHHGGADKALIQSLYDYQEQIIAGVEQGRRILSGEPEPVASVVAPVAKAEETTTTVEPVVEAVADTAEEAEEEIVMEAMPINFMPDDIATEFFAAEAEDEIDPAMRTMFLEESGNILSLLDSQIQAWSDDRANDYHREQLLRVVRVLKEGADMTGLVTLCKHIRELETQLEHANDIATDDIIIALMLHQEHIAQCIEQATQGITEETDVVIEMSENPTWEVVEMDTTPLLAEVSAPVSQKTADIIPFRAERIPRGLPGATEQPVTEKATADTAQQEMIKVGADLLETLVNLAGETSITRSRIEQQMIDLTFSIDDMAATIARLQDQLRRLEMETDAQIQSRMVLMEERRDDFDPLEMDRYSTLQQLTRSLAESASDLLDIRGSLVNKARDTETLLLQQSRINTDLQEGLMRTRMVPFSRLVPRLRRIVRQVGGELKKEVRFDLENVEGELDRSMLERIVAPLEHMLRNAIDHGVEMPDEREQKGKPREGRVLLSLAREGGDVLIRLADDGAGINVDAVRKKAIERGLMAADSTLSEQEILLFIMHAGFSTAAKVTQISGRGVGMDVALSEIKQLGGSLSINSTYGSGTEFVVRLPFTVSVNRALMVRIGDDMYAIPLNSIEGIVRVSPFELENYYDDKTARFEYASQQYQVRYLGALLQTREKPNLDGLTLPEPVILVRSQDHMIALHVDQLLGSREVVVKALGPQFGVVPGLSGATVLGDGSVLVILDLMALVRSQLLHESQQALLEADGHVAAEMALGERAAETITVMVVDDSVTVRKVTTRFLDREGFASFTAKDGADAMLQLQDRIPDVMLLDIEMPRMDGFEVASAVKNNPRLKDIPIIMITSRTGDKHRERAMSIGVERYMGKPYKEDELLETINELVGQRMMVKQAQRGAE